MNWVKKLSIFGIGKKEITFIFLLSTLATFFQTVGISIFLPVFDFIFSSGAQTDEENVILVAISFITAFLDIDRSLINLLLISFLFYLIGQLMVFSIAYVNSYFQGMMMRNIKQDFFRYYLNADSRYYDKVDIGQFVNRVTTEVSTAVMGVMANIKLLVAMVSFIGLIALLITLSLSLTAIIFLIVLLLIPYPIFLIKASTKSGFKNTKYNSFLTSFLVDRLRSPRLVRLSGTSDLEIFEFNQIAEKQRANLLEIHVLKEKIGLIFEPLVVLAALIVLYISVEYLNNPASSTILFMVILVRMVPVIRNLLVQKQSINRTKGAVDSVIGLIDEINKHTPIKVEKPSKNEELSKVNKITLEDISYCYSDNNMILKDVNLVIKKNTINIIIGPSGSGKSTLIDLISGYRVPNFGRIIFDDNQTSSGGYINTISYVPQQPQIFEGSVLNHITYGQPINSSENLDIAIKLSGLENFLNQLPNGLQTTLSNNGENLSGGQKYRLDLARALYQNKPILILDEPTSALDYKSKKEFFNTLKLLKKSLNKIIIVITHDFSLLEVSDQTILVENRFVLTDKDFQKIQKESAWLKGALKDYNFDN